MSSSESKRSKRPRAHEVEVANVSLAASASVAGADARGSDAASGGTADAAAVAGGGTADASGGAADAPATHACACRHKNTPRSAAMQADLERRLNRAIGQLGGVKAMLDDNRYCGDVLIQLAAAQSAIKKVSEILLREHLNTCVVEQVRAGNVEIMDEAMDLVSRFAK